ncbi:MAG: LptA/OstA family protein [Desulfovibrio sp.]|jgi:lipopolysaccharide export system protein LptA|nr:LptA/OstA family protein [Desulfovibrio sp.]
MIKTAVSALLSSLALLVVFFLCGVVPAMGAESDASKKIPTTITSGRMDYDANAQLVHFIGNVHVIRPDFELWSEKMTVFLEKKGEGDPAASDLGGAGMQAGDIDRIVAEGKVRMKSEDRRGTCKKATYYSKDDRFVMEGNPVLTDAKQNVISTRQTIEHYFSTNRSGMPSGGSITFYSPDKTEDNRKGGLKLEAP